MSPVRLLFPFILFSTCFFSPLPAGDAAFSANGERVYCLENGSAHVEEIVLASGKRTMHDLSAGVPKDAVIRAIVRGGDGGLRLAIGAELRRWDPPVTQLETFCRTPDGSEIEEVALEPNSNALLLVSRKSTWLKLPRREALVPVFERRQRVGDAPFFTESGELFFCADGDVWRGSIEVHDTEGAPGGTIRGVLTAARLAPLAASETDEGTPSGEGAREVVVAGERMLVHVSRMGGSGWGDLVRLARPERVGAVDQSSVRNTWELFRKMLVPLDTWEANNGITFLCVAPDQHTVFFRTDEGSWIWNKDASKPEKLSLKD